MFIEHFQMTANPFQEDPPIQWLLCDERFEHALARLKFFLQEGRLALLFGSTGIGKSSLLRTLKKDLPHNRYHPVFLHMTRMNPIAFLRLIAASLGEAPKMGKDRILSQITARIRNTEAETLLIIDEAHLLPPETLIDLRLLISSNIDSCLPLKIVLSAQESLGSTLKRSEHADFLGRRSIQFRLTPLNQAETIAYIDHRLRCAGAAVKIFDSEAKDLIHDYSAGNPRQINNISMACLINAASKNMQQINARLVNETMLEFRLP